VSLTGGAGEASGASGLSAAAPSSCSVVPPSSRPGISTGPSRRAGPARSSSRRAAWPPPP